MSDEALPDTRWQRLGRLAERLDTAGHISDADRMVLLEASQILKRLQDAPHQFSVTSIVSRNTGEGRVDITFHGAMAQVGPAKVREMAIMMLECAAVAEAESMMMKFMKGNGLEDQSASLMLQTFRGYRHGLEAEARTEQEETLLLFLEDQLHVDDERAKRILDAYRAGEPMTPTSLLVGPDGNTPPM